MFLLVLQNINDGKKNDCGLFERRIQKTNEDLITFKGYLEKSIETEKSLQKSLEKLTSLNEAEDKRRVRTEQEIKTKISQSAESIKKQRCTIDELQMAIDDLITKKDEQKLLTEETLRELDSECERLTNKMEMYGVSTDTLV